MSCGLNSAQLPYNDIKPLSHLLQEGFDISYTQQTSFSLSTTLNKKDRPMPVFFVSTRRVCALDLTDTENA